MKFISAIVAVGAAAAAVEAANIQGQPFGTATSGYQWIPDEARYNDNNPIHVGYGNTIHQDSGMLQQRYPNAPLPGMNGMLRFRDDWFHAPQDMNMWTYTGSPFQPFNNPRSPNHLMMPEEYAYDQFFNTVKLDSGLIFNNPQTPQPLIQSGQSNGQFYVLPRDPNMFRTNPLQPYNQNTNLPKPDEARIPFGYAPNGLQYGYNEFTMGLISQSVPNLGNFYNTPGLAPIREYVPQAIVPVAVAVETTAASLPYVEVASTTTTTG